MVYLPNTIPNTEVNIHTLSSNNIHNALLEDTA